MKNEIVPTKKGFPVFKGPLSYYRPKKSSYSLNLRKVSLPAEDAGFDEKIAWLCSSLGFFEDIDKNKNAAAIFKELFLAATKGQVLTSTVLAQRLGMSRGATINHLNHLYNSGLIDKGGKYYFMRQRIMEGIIGEIEDDVMHLFSRMKRVAKEVDAGTSHTINM